MLMGEPAEPGVLILATHTLLAAVVAVAVLFGMRIPEALTLLMVVAEVRGEVVVVVEVRTG